MSKIVVTSGGKIGVLSVGKVSVFDSSGFCNECCACSCNIQTNIYDGYEFYSESSQLPPIANLSCEESPTGVFTWFFQDISWFDVGEGPDCPGTMDRSLVVREVYLTYDTTVSPEQVTMNWQIWEYLYAWEGPVPCEEEEYLTFNDTQSASGSLATLGIEVVDCQLKWETALPGTTITKPVPQPAWPPE